MFSMIALGRSAVFLLFPNLAMVAYFLWAWIDPSSAGPRIVQAAFLWMMVEFLLIHSGGFLAFAAGRPVVFAAFTGFYVVLIFGLASAMGDLWPLVAFVLHAASTFLGNGSDAIEVSVTVGGTVRLPPRWFAMFAAILLAFFLSSRIPLPILGMTEEAFCRMDTGGMTVDGGPLYPEHARSMLATAVLYYLSVAVFEAGWGIWRRMRAARAAQ